MVKQEMVRVNVGILGISKLKWAGMGEINSDDHYIYSVGRNPLEEMGQQKSHGQRACEMSAIVWYFEHSLALSFFGIGMKTELFQSCGHC